jgi:hypothetical protein
MRDRTGDSIVRVASVKRSVSFDEAVLRAAEDEIARGDGNLSAFVNEAVRRQLKVTRMQRMLDEDDALYGPPDEALVQELMRRWD